MLWEEKSSVLCSFYFLASKLIWQSVIGGQKTLLVCLDRIIDILIIYM
jgi:hypothetical protein